MSQWCAAFGLTFCNTASDLVTLPFAEIDPPAGAVDVTVRLGQVATALPGAVANNGLWSVKPGAFHLSDTPVGRLMLLEGRELIIDPAAGASASDLRIYITGSAIAALLMQRQIVPLHASAVLMDGNAVLFAGPAGPGKSTLLAALLQRGYTALSDDVVGVVLAPDGTPQIRPGYPVIKLWEDVLAKIPMPQDAGETTQIRDGLAKHVLPVEQFDMAQRPLRHIYLLGQRVKGDVSAKRIQGPQLIEQLRSVCYRKRMIQGLGAQPAQFAALAALVKHVPTFVLPRKNIPFSATQMADCVEQTSAGSDA